MSIKTKNVPCRLFLAAVLLQAALTGGIWAQNNCAGGDRVRRVDVWGSPATTFSPTPATTLEELKTQFAAYEADYAAVLRQAGWEGDPEDLFATVRNAQEGGAVTFRSAPKGTEFEWMAYRRRGTPACVRDIIWVGRDPFPAWQVVVESKGVEYTFVLPQACLNLGFEKGQRREVPGRPTCTVDASYQADRDIITITGSSNVPDFRIVAVEGPGASLEQLQSAGGGRWTLQPGADGTFTFTARATADSGKQSECSASVAVVRGKPDLKLAATADPDTNLITVDANGSVGDVSLTGVTLPDGSAGNLAALQTTDDPLVWTFDPSDSLPRKAGDYPYTFAGVARLRGYEDSGDATVSINVAKRAARWIVRVFGAYLDASDEFNAAGIRTAPPFAGQQESSVVKIDSGTGFGLGLEYLFNDRFGVEAGVIVADLDTHFLVDIGELWGMADDETQFAPLTLGVNYHVTPNKRVDFFVGPFIALVQYDDVDFNTLGETFTYDFEDDWTWGLNFGLDVPFGSENPWAFTGGVKYIETSAEGPNDIPDLDVDPVILTAGIAYRFK